MRIQSSTFIESDFSRETDTSSAASGTRYFLRSVLLVSGGTIAAQLLAAATAPVLTRLFSPADFGLLGAYTVLLGVLSTAITLRYESAIPLAESEVETANLFALSIGIAAINSGVLLMAILVLRPWLLSWQKTAGLAAHALWLPPGVLAVAVYRTLSVWAIRRREYRALAETKITQTASMIGIQIGSGLLRIGIGGLLVGQIIGQAGGCGTLARRTLLAERGWLRGLCVREISRAARKFARFPKFSTGAVLLNSCSEALVVLCLMWMFGPIVTGFYILVQRLVFVPGNIVVSSVSQVFFGETCQLNRENRLDLIRTNYMRRFRQLLLLGISGAGIGAIIAPRAVPMIFGAKWQPAGLCVQIFAPAFAAWLPASSLAGVLDAFQRQDLHLKREIVRTALILTGFGVARVCAMNWVSTFIIISLGYTLDMIFYATLSWRSLCAAKLITLNYVETE